MTQTTLRQSYDVSHHTRHNVLSNKAVQVRLLATVPRSRNRHPSTINNGDRFEVQLTSFEFRCFRADLRPKTKPKTKTLKQFRPKTKMAETTINCHFRCRKRKRKRISVGLYITCSSFLHFLKHCLLILIRLVNAFLLFSLSLIVYISTSCRSIVNRSYVIQNVFRSSYRVSRALLS